MKALLSRRCLGVMFGLATVIALASTGAYARFIAGGSRSPLTNPAAIQKLATKAYIWGLAPEFIYRFLKYNTLVTAPLNNLGGGGAAAAWNNNATNAGNASVLYLNALIDLSGQRGRGGSKELVLTVPPSKTDYYVVNLLDDFINTVGGIGTRTTLSTRAQTYLIVGPTSQYAHKRIVRIRGFTYRVIPYDTNFGWILIRIRADTLVPASDPASAASILKNVVERFAMSTLAQFEARGHRPKYFKPGQYTPTPEQIKGAAKWHSSPTNAVAFFKQMGESLRLNPLPTVTTGLNGIPLSTLPSWISPQPNAIRRYRNPSFPQQQSLALFRPLGLTANGFRIPSNWGPKQINALQAGYVAGQTKINGLLTSSGVSAATNFWNYLNHDVGSYPNTLLGYQYRALIVIAGGSANLALDAVYPQLNSLDGTSATALDGNNTYKLTFTPPVTNPATLPVVGALPPTVNDSQGNPKGFWSIHAYALDSTQSSAPFITQASVLNTAYSSANLPVTAVDPSTDTITVEPSTWGPLVASSPILFGSTAATYGLTPGVPYYVATAPTAQTDPTTKATTYSFKISTEWLQQLSAANVPIQGTNGHPGSVAHLMNPGGPVNLQWGPIQPVSQLGSQQLTSGKLVKNADGSVTIWIAPTLPAGAPATNWLPTPSSAYYATLYPGVKVPTQIRLTIRIYYPAPGSDTQASILPPPNASTLPPPIPTIDATYVFPALQKVG
ncbi:MAG: DUF1254 domain-containing protein [Solirubrobacterales bacterium]|nr:DUF1254 domain-containing protein [Solirubrobacterales bacterium]